MNTPPQPAPQGFPAHMDEKFQALHTLCLGSRSADRHRLLRDYERLVRRARDGNLPTDDLEKLFEKSKSSYDVVQQRIARRPPINFPPELPVSEKRDEIARALAAHQVLIVCGATGSGKTTQLPKICLDQGRGTAGLIGCTQPRRIAARTVAARIAEELGSPLGEAVGYQVRFHDKGSAENYIKVMTDGILLAETQGDRFLSAYDTLIIDEAHERSLNIDFLLGYLKQLLPRRPDLKVVITSATIDAERFSRHFNNAPVVEVSGRLFPVEIRYRPVEATDEGTDRDLEQAMLDAVDELHRAGPGDVLIFLPGEREIRETAEALRKHHPPGTEILPLFARQSAAEQERVFRPTGSRRVVLATNVAETSLTVPGIRYVIDPGFARIKRYSYRNKVDMLLTEKISQASANQRAGRCGRVAAGICIRLYSEDDFQARPAFTDPEILRTSLAGTILRMEALRLGDVTSFPFIDPPQPRMIADGYQLLAELGAVDAQQRLTEIGRKLARIPVDPKIGRMLLAGETEHCLREITIIAAALSVQDPRVRPMEASGSADQKHKLFTDERSDFLSYLKLWAFFEDALKHKKSNRKLLQDCQAHFLSLMRLREWRDIHNQLHTLVAEMGFRANQTDASYEEIHRALLAGLLGNIGVKTEDGSYQGPRDIKFHVFPGSVLHKKGPKWVVAAEIVETTRLYGRTLARVEPDWIEKVGAHLVKRHYFEPHWEKRAGHVAAFERVSLYGLVLNPKRRVHYGPLDPTKAREIFIRAALVEGQLESRAPFLRHNQQLLEEVRELEHKSRRQDVLVDEDRMAAFYETRVPPGISNAAAFEKWRKEAERKDPHLLYMQRDDLMRHGADEVSEELFPASMPVGRVECELTYRFEPGHVMDGVTLNVPLHLLNQIDEIRCQWLVPGMLREKITALVKCLPKQLRRNCVPVPEFVTETLSQLGTDPWSRPLLDSLAKAVQRRTGAQTTLDAWDGCDLPPHLLMNFRVIDEKSQELGMGRDLHELRRKLGQAAQLTFSRTPKGSIERSGMIQWDFGDLPEQIAFERDGAQLIGFPALTDEGDSVALRVLDTLEAARRETRAGIRRLLRITLREQMKALEKSLSGMTQVALQARSLMNAEELKEDMIGAITDRAFLGDDELPRDAKGFDKQKERARARLAAVQTGLSRLVAEIFTEYHAILGRLGKVPAPVAADIREQLNQLVYRGFLSETPWDALQHYPRYLKAADRRLDKLQGAIDRDARHMSVVRGFMADYSARREKHRKSGTYDPKLDQFRWMIEELRVSLFAQELKTPTPVSAKRLQKLWQEIAP